MAPDGQIHVSLLGWPKAHVVQGRKVWMLELPGAKPSALLAYLLMARRTVSRETLMALFWPNSDTAHAQTSLRNALYQLQKGLPEGALEVSRYTVSLSSRYTWVVDVHQLEALLEPPVSSEALDAALALYQGDFLEGLHISEAEEFELWRTTLSQRLRVRFLEALNLGIQEAMRYGLWERAEVLLRKAVWLEPWREDFHKALIHALIWQGKYTAAFKQYQDCCAALKAHMGLEPGPELETLAESIRERRQRPPVFQVPPMPMPFVDREDALRTVYAWLEESRLVTVVAPSGMGKTALVLAFAHRHRHRFRVWAFAMAILKKPGITPKPPWSVWVYLKPAHHEAFHRGFPLTKTTRSSSSLSMSWQ